MLMYGCDFCATGFPEGNFYANVKHIRVTPAGKWICTDCFNMLKDEIELLGFHGHSWEELSPPSYEQIVAMVPNEENSSGC